MNWESILNDQFVRLSFRNSLDNNSFSMEAYGIYKFNKDSTINGSWFDSRGITFPLNGQIQKNTLIINWGSPDIEEGRTEYALKPDGSMAVKDFVLRDGVYDLFGEALYTSAKEYHLQGITLAATDMNAMLTFYKGVFNVDFEEVEVDGYTLYQGRWLDNSLLICPAEFAGNHSEQTRHQLDITVPDLDDVIEKVKNYGGEIIDEVTLSENKRSIGIYDPDKNSMILIESTTNKTEYHE